MYFLFFLFFRGPEDTINDCKILFIEEMYKIEKPGAYPLTFGDGDFKSTRSLNYLNISTNGVMFL